MYGRPDPSLVSPALAAGRRGLRAMLDLFTDARGSTALTFAVVAVPLILLVGGGTDVYMAESQKTKLQGLLDAAVLAGSHVQSEGGDGVQTVKTYLTKNFAEPFGVVVTDDTQIDKAKSLITSTVRTKVSTSFLTLIGMSEMEVEAKSAATFGGQATEVAIALDVTGSMNAGTKLADAKAAAKDLVDILFTIPGSKKKNDNVKVGVVPFSAYVAIGTSYRGQSWLDVPPDTSTTTYSCQKEWTCTGGYTTKPATCTSDGVPYACTQSVCNASTSTMVCKDRTSTTKWYGCVGSRTGGADLYATASSGSKIPGLMNVWCNAPLTRLTNNQKTVTSAIASLTANGETYIAPGVLWAWRLLSPNAPFADGATDPGTTRKVIVLMTDGANTLSANGQYHNGKNVAASNDMLLKTCANAKAEKITVYTVAFDVSDTSIKKILGECASGSNYFYDSKNAEELKTAFTLIGEQISSRRLVY